MQNPAEMHIIEEEINKENIALLDKHGYEYIKKIKRPTKTVIEYANTLKEKKND